MILTVFDSFAAALEVLADVFFACIDMSTCGDAVAQK